MAAFIGHIGEYDESEPWESYSERLEHYFTANDVDEDHQVPAFLALVGAKTYALAKNLCSPQLPKDLTLEALLQKLSDHLDPKPSVITQRFRFHKRDQRTGENISDFVADLRRLAIHCEFGAALSDTLRDRVVCGLNQEHIQKRLLAEKELTLDNAIKTAVAMETAGKDATELQTRRAPVNKISHTQKQKQKPEHKQELKFPAKRNSQCYRCGGKHRTNTCFHRNSMCTYCGKTGHLENVCLQKERDNSYRSHNRRQYKKINYVDLPSDSEEEESDDALLLHIDVNNVSTDPIIVNPQVAGKMIPMEVDTGSAVSLVSKSTIEKFLPEYRLQNTNLKLRTFSGEQIRPLGSVKVNVSINGQSADLDLFVVKQEGPSLLGRDWLGVLRLNWTEIKTLRYTKTQTSPTTSDKVKTLVEKHKAVFSPEIGKLQGQKGKLTLKENTHPKFVKARQVPYSLRPKVEEELDRLVKEGVISPVQFSDWATPIVPVVKPNNRVRICGDYKTTVNPALNVEQYPLPRIEDIFASLAGGKRFSKIDLTQAYLQMELDDTSQDLLIINTHKGLYRYHRLPFGIASSPAIWQRAMDQVLQGIPYTKCILDDMIITGRNDEEHLQNLSSVLQRLEEHGLRANLDKCQFLQERISYCGHHIDENGLHKSPEKVEAVQKAPRPETVTQLRSWLGLVNYYHKFLPGISTVLAPLNELLQQGKKWHWSSSCEHAFNKVKELMTSEQVLCHYDPDLPLRVASDASPYGLGAVISHVFPDGSERPIAFASRSLSKAEKGYSQIDKEALGIYWSVQKFQTYLYGRKFTLVTDHRPLVSIFSPGKALPTTTAARLQRYAVFLSGHTYDIEYKNTTQHGNADALSRLPLSETEEGTMPDPESVFYTSQVEKLPISSTQIRRETQRDTVLSQVLDFIVQGTERLPEEDEFKPYHNRRNELTCHHGCLMWGNRVIIPESLRGEVLTELHEGHAGIVRTKSLARSHTWWPGIDSDIEKMCQSCAGCQHYLPNPKTSPVHPWDWPTDPWERLHIDYAGPFRGGMYLIVVDAHSKWPEVVPMTSTTATATIEALRSIFARFGLPKVVVSDNGPQFVAEQFEDFLKTNGVKHITSTPYHPRTNGLAEKFVQTFKSAMKKSGKSVNQSLNAFLCRYRNTPHATTGETPAKLLFGRNIRTRLDLMKPDIKSSVQEKQQRMTWSKHTGETVREFETGQSVMVRDYRGKIPWISAVVQSKIGPLTYKVKTTEGADWRRHVDQIRHTGDGIESRSYPVVDLPDPSHIAEATIPPEGKKMPMENPGRRSPPVTMENSKEPVTMATPRQPHVSTPRRQGSSASKPVCQQPDTSMLSQPNGEQSRYPRRENRHAPNRLDL